MRYLFLALLLVLAHPVCAADDMTASSENTQSKGVMNTITVMSPEQQRQIFELQNPKKPAAKEEEETKAEKDKAKEKAEDDDLPPLKRKSAEKPVITPLKDLKAWDGMDDAYTALASKEAAALVIRRFEDDPARVPPQGMLLIAQLYANQDEMEMAARYYYAAQLRARFDYARWPINGPGNPYSGFTSSVKDMGSKIAGWATSTSKRLATVMNDAREWDADTSYSYLPDYKLPTGDKIPKEDTWPTLLSASRDAFFGDSAKITQALQKMGR